MSNVQVMSLDEAHDLIKGRGPDRQPRKRKSGLKAAFHEGAFPTKKNKKRGGLQAAFFAGLK